MKRLSPLVCACFALTGVALPPGVSRAAPPSDTGRTERPERPVDAPLDLPTPKPLGDVITLLDGTKIVGRVGNGAPGGSIRIVLSSGESVDVPLDEIRSIEAAPYEGSEPDVDASRREGPRRDDTSTGTEPIPTRQRDRRKPQASPGTPRILLLNTTVSDRVDRDSYVYSAAAGLDFAEVLHTRETWGPYPSRRYVPNPIAPGAVNPDAAAPPAKTEPVRWRIYGTYIPICTAPCGERADTTRGNGFVVDVHNSVPTKVFYLPQDQADLTIEVTPHSRKKRSASIAFALLGSFAALTAMSMVVIGATKEAPAGGDRGYIIGGGVLGALGITSMVFGFRGLSKASQVRVRPSTPGEKAWLDRLEQ